MKVFMFTLWYNHIDKWLIINHKHRLIKDNKCKYYDRVEEGFKLRANKEIVKCMISE